MPSWRGSPLWAEAYYVRLFTEIIIFALMATSFNLLFGYTGLLSFGHAGFLGVGAYGCAIILRDTRLSTLVASAPAWGR